MLTGALVLFFLLIFFILYLKYYERKGIYFPIRKIDLTPREIGLEFEDVYFFSSDETKLNGWYIPAGTLEISATGLKLLICSAGLDWMFLFSITVAMEEVRAVQLKRDSIPMPKPPSNTSSINEI
jgi:hypothetical protein